MHGDAFMQLSVVIVLAAAVSLVMRMLRQPLIIGYIITGILVGPSLLNVISDHASFNVFSDIGIALLLFIVGLELNTAVIRQMGKAVLVTAAGLLAVMASLGFATATLLGFSQTEALIVGLALFFSSTIIIAKVLSDKREMSRLHGQIAIGIILLDDVVATLALLFVAAGGGGSLGVGEISSLALKGGGLLVVFGLISGYVLPRATKFMATSQELLFLFSLAWGFGVATLVHKAGFSIEIGALFAGVMLAHLPYVAEIGARLKQLRNFFVVLFFVVLGEGLSIANLGSAVVPALIFSAIVIIAKPVAVMTSLGLLGYTKRTGFKAAINLSQISEFSIILVVLAHSSGLVGSQLAAVITLVALITIATSTYLMQYDNAIYMKLERLLGIFERKDTKERETRHKNYALLLFGYKKGGHEFVKTFRTMKKSYLVVDYNPDVVELLDRQQIPCLYGDATDIELLNELHVQNAKMAVSAITDFSINKVLVRYIAEHNKSAVIICHADDHNQAAELYGLGATYVMLPHYIGSERMSQFIYRRGLDKKDFEEYRERHLLAINNARSDIA
jgi:Kef-type K+ transport system membrane component KefB